MLFRRISAHLKRQDWFAVGLDLLIVVVGRSETVSEGLTTCARFRNHQVPARRRGP